MYCRKAQLLHLKCIKQYSIPSQSAYFLKMQALLRFESWRFEAEQYANTWEIFFFLFVNKDEVWFIACLRRVITQQSALEAKNVVEELNNTVRLNAICFIIAT